MPHYIRFLKPPRTIQPEGIGKKKDSFKRTVVARITITTDLGDAFLHEDVRLLATLRLGGKGEGSSLQKEFVWKATNREMEIELGPISTQWSDCDWLRMSVRAADAPGDWNIEDSLHECRVFSAWSSRFQLRDEPTQAEKLVLRRFAARGSGPGLLNIWEETGNSIARHIWDAALAFVLEIRTCLAEKREGTVSPSSLRDIFWGFRDKTEVSGVTVLELGTGCGVVGIALAQMLQRCSVFLTDLEEARGIATRNANAAKLAPGSTVQFEVLDWDQEIEDEVSSRDYDLILVSDCTYNSDSMPALVRTLGALVKSSPNAMVLVALKRRHESEEVFFTLMEGAGFEKKRQEPANNDSRHSPCHEEVEIYCFWRQGSSA